MIRMSILRQLIDEDHDQESTSTYISFEDLLAPGLLVVFTYFALYFCFELFFLFYVIVFSVDTSMDALSEGGSHNIICHYSFNCKSPLLTLLTGELPYHIGGKDLNHVTEEFLFQGR